MTIERPLLRVCVTGPESTGKTTLAAALASALGTAWAREASRLYVEECNRPLLASDVGPIARRVITLGDAAARQAGERGSQHVVLDTDLVSTIVYARHYYGTVPRWVLDAERTRRADLYLLCDIDVPWVSDGVRDRPTQRAALHAAFRAALARRHARVVALRGEPIRRLALALDAVRALDAERKRHPAPAA